MVFGDVQLNFSLSFLWLIFGFAFYPTFIIKFTTTSSAYHTSIALLTNRRMH